MTRPVRIHGRGNIGRSSPAHMKLHLGLQMIRQLHCDRREQPNHVCVGRMTVHPTGVDLDCTLCGSLDVRDDDQLSVDAMESACRAAAAEEGAD